MSREVEIILFSWAIVSLWLLFFAVYEINLLRKEIDRLKIAAGERMPEYDNRPN